MIPASWAVASASPFGSARSRARRLGRHRAPGRARRRGGATSGLPPTSTMWTLPASSTWLEPLIARISDRESSSRPVLDGVEVGELRVDPGGDVVLADLGPDRVEPPSSLALAGMSAPRGAPSAWPATSNGLTVSAHSPSSSCAPAFSERTSTPSRSFTSGASFATRFMPSKIAFTSRTSYCLYAATACGKLSSTRSSSGSQPSCGSGR